MPLTKKRLVSSLAVLLVFAIVGVAATATYISRRRSPEIEFVRRDAIPAALVPAAPVSEVLSIESTVAVGPVVLVSVTPPPDATEVQISTDPSFETAEWRAVADEIPVRVDSEGYQILFARFRLASGDLSNASTVGVDVDSHYSAATASAFGAHQPSWVRPWSAERIVVRVEEGRVKFGHLELLDRDVMPAGYSETSGLFGAQMVQRDGDAYGVFVSGRDDVLKTFDQFVGSDLNASALLEGWRIESTDDKNYASAVDLGEASLVSRPTGGGRGEGNDLLLADIHDFALELPTNLVEGASYTVSHATDDIQSANFTFRESASISPAVVGNQAGYATTDELKVAYLTRLPEEAAESREFFVVDEKRDVVVLRGRSSLRDAANEMGQGDLTGLMVYELNFSDIDEPGSYRVCVEATGCSYSFRISDDSWMGLTMSVARAMYHQRSGTTLGQPFTSFERPRSYHPDDGYTVESSSFTLYDAQAQIEPTFEELIAGGTGELVPAAWGGHFDAGDWDRRIQHLWYVRTASELVSLYPEYYADLDMNLPESGDAIPDLLDEALWSLDFYKRMQTPEGAISGGVEASQHPPPWSTSWVDDLTVYAYAPDAWSSYMYAGVASEAAVALRPYANELADEYLESALKAMEWAEANGGPDTDEERMVQQRNVASGSLLMATSDTRWHDVFVESADYIGETDAYLACHAHARCDAMWSYLKADPSVTISEIRDEFTASFIASADVILTAAEGTKFGWTTEHPFVPLVWGLGAGGAPHSSGLAKAYALTGEAKYRNAIARSAAVSLGANPLNMSLVTGVGKEPVRYPLIVDVNNGGLPAWPGTPVYGFHQLNNVADESWAPLYAFPGSAPDANTLPYLQQWFDVANVAFFNEFTVHQSHSEALLAFGTLAATV